MYKPHQDAEFLPVDYKTTEIANSDKVPVPSLSVTASRKDGVINVGIANPDLKNGQTILLTWDSMGKPKKGSVSARILTSKKVNDYNDFGQKAKVEPTEFTDYKVTDKGIEIKLPAISIVTIAIK